MNSYSWSGPSGADILVSSEKDMASRGNIVPFLKDWTPFFKRTT
jgi:hypothetical protein